MLLVEKRQERAWALRGSVAYGYLASLSPNILVHKIFPMVIIRLRKMYSWLIPVW